MKSKTDRRTALRIAAVWMLLLALLMQTGCIRDTFTKEEESAKQAEAEAAVEAFLSERLPGAEATQVYAYRATNYGAFYLTDIAQAEVKSAEGETFILYLNTKTGEAYRSGGGEEASAAALELYLEARGISPERIVSNNLSCGMLIPTGQTTGDIRIDYLAGGVPFDCEDEEALAKKTGDGILFAVSGDLVLSEGDAIEEWASAASVQDLKARFDLVEWNCTIEVVKNGFEMESICFDGNAAKYQAYELTEKEGLWLYIPVKSFVESGSGNGGRRDEVDAREAAEAVSVNVSAAQIEVRFDETAIEYIHLYAPAGADYANQRYTLETKEGPVTLVWRELDDCYVMAADGEIAGYYFSESFTLKAE